MFVEPFAGGGIAGLTVAFEHLADRVLLAEIDPDVASVWRAMLNGKNSKLADRILDFDLTIENVREVLSKQHRTILDRAFATILRNRVQHGGILAPGATLMRAGENGKGVGSRWYPETLATRIRNINTVRDRLSFTQGDAFEVIESLRDAKNVVYFIDPPYTIAGRRLYRYSEIDHKKLFDTMASVAGDVLLTYDDTPEVRAWAARCNFAVESVAMMNRQNSRKSELLIGRDLSWVQEAS